MSTPARTLLLHLLPAVGLAGCAIGTEKTTACMEVELDATSCAAAEDVNPEELFGSCGATITKITGEGTLSEGQVGDVFDTAGGQVCCYPVVETPSTCDYGRPYLESGAPRVAPVGGRRRGGWVANLRPDLAGLDAVALAALAERWTVAAQDEHAAVAAFSRVALELLAVGAPASLVDATHRAARDEVRHARMGFGLASAYAGRVVAPGRFPFAAPVMPSGDLVALAAAAAREGCVGETVSTLLALEALRRATDPAARGVLAAIGRDETRHAALAWRTVRWAMHAGGAPVRAAVAEVFAQAARDGVDVPLRGDFDDPAVLARHGLLDRASTRATADEALQRVILPCARGLLDGRAAFVRAYGADSLAV
ncbi:MAG: ferritin-like domain-containing protein [Pseudomonadota bacterium]|nr:ferritin-like domain-containing protein [Pseudomonadota bacterium]